MPETLLTYQATIPGRPPLDYYLHERSISAPGLRSDSWHQNFPDNGSGVSISNDTVQLKGSSSSKALAPLVIPATSNPTPQKLFRSRCPANTSVYSQSSPPQVPPKSKFFLEKNSTKYLATDQTIMYSSTKPELSITSDSAHLTPFTSLNDSPSRKQLTPNISKDKQVETFQHKSASKAAPTRTGHFRGQSDMAHGPALRSDGHRREQSETLIMDRGRPKRRIDKSQDYRPIENERKALETLPQGIKAKQANSRYDDAEIDTLRRQALGQAAKFEVLASKDVDSLSRVGGAIGYATMSRTNIGFRSFAPWMNVANISASRNLPSVPFSVPFTNKSATIYVLQRLPLSPVKLF